MSLAPAERFEIRGLRGEGAMGVVFEAYDHQERLPVALKTVRDFDADAGLFLRREFRALRGIRHRNLVRLYELVADAADCFFTMELLDGVNLYEAARGDAPVGQLPATPLATVASLFLQVADGLAAVHGAERLHRDIKPTNVMVAADGRAVVLDFGLAHVFSPGALVTSPDGMSGTIEYVSPEQAWQDGLGPATDWYSFGVMLYEALSGRVPFEGLRTGPRMMALRERDPAPVSEVVPGVPPDLVELLVGLLRRDPEERAGYAAIVEVLARYAVGERSAVSAASARLPFVGREEQLDALCTTWRGVREGVARAALVYVRGPSGMGKSEVLRRFIARIEADRRLVVLQGRCQPQENVPFKAFDAVVDELALYLERQPDDFVRALLPAEPAVLLRIFPVLERVPALAPFVGAALPVEPQELRRQGYRAFRELLRRLTVHEPVLLHVDDFQWGDLDSVQLLAELLRGPDAPRLVVVVAHRSEDTDTSPALLALRAVTGGDLADITHTVEVGPLSPADLADLGARLRGGSLLGASIDVDALVAQANGSPFFVGELVRWQQALGGDAPAALSVADVIRARVQQLSVTERRVLETIALAGHPLDPHLALRAAGLSDGGGEILYDLDETFLRRVAAGTGLDAVEPLHDRIREVVAADVPAREQGELHLALAIEIRALPDADPLHLMEHYRKGGDLGEAAWFGEIAASAAESSLAFSLAADVYRTVVELKGAAAGWELCARHADALRNAGRGVESAEVYLDAAARAEASEPGGAANDATRRLRQLAAEQLLHNGRIDRGMALLTEGLGRIGVLPPATPWRALGTAVWQRVRLMWRGLTFQARDPAELDPQVRARLDTLWGATISMSMFSHTRADPLGVIHLLEALDAGDAARVERALRYEAAFQVGFTGGLAGRVLARTGVLDAVATLPLPEDDPYDRAWAHLCACCVAWFQADWRRCAEEGLAGERLFRSECRGAHFEVSVINLFRLAALVFLGEVAQVRERVEEGLRDAQARGDRFAATIYQLGEPLSAWLYADRPDDALRIADEAIAAWPSADFDTQDYHHLLGRAQALLYAGRPWAALEHLDAGWPALRRSMLLEYRAVRAEMLHLRARVLLAAAAKGEPPPGMEGWSRPRLLATARKLATRVAELSELGWSAPLAASIEAGVAAMEGRKGEARDRLVAAAEGFEREGMRVMAQAMWHRAAILGPVEGAGLATKRAPSVAEVEETLAAWGVVAPARLVAMLAPVGSSLPELGVEAGGGVLLSSSSALARRVTPSTSAAPAPSP